MKNYSDQKQGFPKSNKDGKEDYCTPFKCPKCGMPLFGSEGKMNVEKQSDNDCPKTDAEEKGRDYRIKECPNCHYKFEK